MDENRRNVAMNKSGLNTDPTNVTPQNDPSQLHSRIFDQNELSRKLLDIQAQVFQKLLNYQIHELFI